MRLILILALLINSFSILADDARPVLIQVVEETSYQYKILFRVPNNGRLSAWPELQYSSMCKELHSSQIITDDSRAQHLILQCKHSLQGEFVKINYLSINPGFYNLFRFTSIDGQQSSKLLNPSQNSWKIPKKQSKGIVMQEFTLLGIEHILAGMDHLLFVTCLVLLTAGRWKQLLLAVTGFTLAHSLTLASAALGLVYLPIPPVEAVIALSILFLATEIARQRHGNLTYKYPVLVSSSFGLLHGFGFASVLMDVGLPQQDTGIALLGFNIGVEIGQLLFISVLLVIMSFFAAITKQTIYEFFTPKKARYEAMIYISIIYVVGSLSAYWTFERLNSFL
ncbi:MAG: hypothetical protein ACI9LE_000487 [Paraglaciecola sp.]|jgi:hypothetical protein